jgi:hypothetical protein
MYLGAPQQNKLLDTHGILDWGHDRRLEQSTCNQSGNLIAKNLRGQSKENGDRDSGVLDFTN